MTGSDQKAPTPPEEPPSVRLDVWLNVACIFRTRSQAKLACERNRVQVNGNRAKPHHLVRPDDRVEIAFDDWKRILIIRGIRQKSVSKVEARQLYDDVSPPRPRLDLIDRILKSPPVTRDRGKGRPTKKERRQIDDWRS